MRNGSGVVTARIGESMEIEDQGPAWRFSAFVGDEDRICWWGRPEWFPHITVFGSSADDVREQLRFEVIREVAALGQRLTRLVEIIQEPGLSKRPIEKFNTCRSVLHDIEILARCNPALSWAASLLLQELAAGCVGTADGAFLARVCEIGGFLPDDCRGWIDLQVADFQTAALVNASLRDHPGVTQFALREALGLDKETMTRILGRLESFGRIRRIPSARTNFVYPVMQDCGDEPPAETGEGEYDVSELRP